MKGQNIAAQSTRCGRLVLLTLFLCLLLAEPSWAQTPAATAAPGTEKKREGGTPGGAAGVKPAAGLQDETVYQDIIRKFSASYRLGPADEMAIRVKGQPDYSLEKAKVSPVGTIYHPLLGEVMVAGATIDQLKQRLTNELSEYVLDPIVSIELLEAHSAKVGVIGEVKTPRIIALAGPMTVFDAITEAGGFADTAKKTNVTLLRQNPDGSRTQLKVNVKNVLEAKASPQDNIPLQAGDTVIVHGNAMKILPIIASFTSFTGLLTFLSIGGGGGR